MTQSTRLQKIRQTGNFGEYHAVNLLIFLFVLGLSLAVKFNWISVRCVYAEQGILCKTCGLTRAFSGVLKGNLSVENPAFSILFLLIGGQLLLRPLVSFLLFKTQKQTGIRNSDILVSIGLLVAFLIVL